MIIIIIITIIIIVIIIMMIIIRIGIAINFERCLTSFQICLPDIYLISTIFLLLFCSSFLY